MYNWKFEKLGLSGAYKITPFYSEDNRGGFLKDYSSDIFANNDIIFSLKEVFYTISKKGVIRAIHFQNKMQQAKLVRCVHGRIYDVLVDLRKESPTFKQWLGFELSSDNNVELLIPEGFGHGYLVLEDSIVSYKCNERFYGEYDSGIKFDDPDLNIKWPYEKVGGKDLIICSNKDSNLQSFVEFLEKYEEFI